MPGFEVGHGRRLILASWMIGGSPVEMMGDDVIMMGLDAWTGW